jgi:phosphatidylserine/phosphatidylglycerophosphate/cardiolipin synthase-like enzyme
VTSFRNIRMTFAAVALAAGAGACGSAPQQQSPPPVQSAASSPSSATVPAPVAAPSTDAPAGVRHSPHPAAALRVLAEPGAGIGPIYQFITKARSSVDLTMYETVDSTAEADLAADAARGVDVRVILDQHLEKSANTGAYEYLIAHGVHVRWGPPGPPTIRRPSPSMTPPRSS